MPPARRLDPGRFHIPVDDIRRGYYTDVYFNRARTILQADGRAVRVRMQVFARCDALLCGIDEALAPRGIGMETEDCIGDVGALEPRGQARSQRSAGIEPDPAHDPETPAEARHAAAFGIVGERSGFRPGKGDMPAAAHPLDMQGRRLAPEIDGLAIAIEKDSKQHQSTVRLTASITSGMTSNRRG